MFTFLSFILLDLLVQTRSIWLVRPPSWLWIALLATSGSQSGWMALCAPECIMAFDSFSTCDCTALVFMCVCVRLDDGAVGWGALWVCVLKCVIARHKRPLISALRQPLAQPSSFLKCPAVLTLTYNSQVNGPHARTFSYSHARTLSFFF